jgi:hypothetical protein
MKCGTPLLSAAFRLEHDHISGREPLLLLGIEVTHEPLSVHGEQKQAARVQYATDIRHPPILGGRRQVSEQRDRIDEVE